jgi:pilus assembly protein CpaE
MSIFLDEEIEETGGPLTLVPLERSRPGSKRMGANSLRADQLVDVLLVTRDVEVKEKVANAFKDKNRFNLRAINARAVQFEETAAEAGKPQLLILDLDSANVLDTEALERLKKAHYADTPIIVISSYLDQDTVRTLVQIKVDDWLPKDCQESDIYKSCERVIRTPVAAAKPESNATCYTFFPVSGGAGCTTLVIQSAFLLGRKEKRLESTCIVDLNFQDGTVADYLDLRPAFNVEDLSSAPGRLDRQLLDVMLSRHPSGLAVLAAPRFPGHYVEVSEGLVASVLGLLSRSFKTIVVDLPKVWFPWTDNVIWGSDKVFVVARFTVPSLRQARFVADAIVSKASTSTQVGVIINKFHEPLFGSGLLRKDAERLLGPRLAGFIPDAGNAVTEAINRGLPVSEVQPGSKLEKRLGEVIGLEAALAARS